MKINDLNDPILMETLELDLEIDDNITTQHTETQVEWDRAAACRESIVLMMWKDYRPKRSHK
jgi:hypothetical protein